MFDREPNIDIVFRNGLKDLEVLPPSDVWDEMPPVTVSHRPSKIVYAAVAGLAMIISISAALSALFRTDNARQSDLAANIPGASFTGTNAYRNSGVSIEPETKQAKIIRPVFNEVAESNPVASGSVSTLPVEQPAEPAAMNELPDNASAGNHDSEKRVNLSGLFASGSFGNANINIIPVETRETKSKSSNFMIGGSLAPAMSIISDGGNRETKKLLTTENSMPELSAGLSVRYKISSRFSIQTGVGVTSLGQIVKGIDVYSGLSNYYSAKGKFNYVVQTASGQVIASNTDIRISDASSNRVGSVISEVIDPSKLPLSYINDDLKQRFRYLEVPLIARYKLIDRRVDMNLCGGISYGYLIENVAFATEDGKDVKVGYTEGVNKNSISSQLGFGMEYNISKSISFNLEPVVRYYITPFSDASSTITRQYSFGIFSGLFYRF
jgi:hypothetical protein